MYSGVPCRKLASACECTKQYLNALYLRKLVLQCAQVCKHCRAPAVVSVEHIILQL